MGEPLVVQLLSERGHRCAATVERLATVRKRIGPDDRAFTQAATLR